MKKVCGDFDLERSETLLWFFNVFGRGCPTGMNVLLSERVILGLFVMYSMISFLGRRIFSEAAIIAPGL